MNFPMLKEWIAITSFNRSFINETEVVLDLLETNPSGSSRVWQLGPINAAGLERNAKFVELSGMRVMQVEFTKIADVVHVAVALARNANDHYSWARNHLATLTEEFNLEQQKPD